jgi:hypothetical protein
VSSKESVDEILKEIVVKAVSEYLDQPVNPNLPKTNTKKNIAQNRNFRIHLESLHHA